MTHSHTSNIRLFMLAGAALFAVSQATAQTMPSPAPDASAPVTTAPATPGAMAPDGATAPVTTTDELNKMSPASGKADPAVTAPSDAAPPLEKPKSKKRHSNKPK
jgi:hypothetical protein